MPSSTATSTADQRQAIYELVRDHLGGLSDFCIALDHKDFATAQRLGLEFGEDFRLLADLGWDENDSRRVVALTMPAEKLLETLERLRTDALDGVSESRHERRLTEEENETRERYQLILDTCDELMGALDLRAGRDRFRPP